MKDKESVTSKHEKDKEIVEREDFEIMEIMETIFFIYNHSIVSWYVEDKFAKKPSYE